MNATLFQQLARSTVSPYEELMAYEYLYSREDMTLKKMTGMTSRVGRTPSQALDEQPSLFNVRESDEYRRVADYVDGKIGTFDLAVAGTPSWPSSLSDSARPSPVLYTRGSIGLMGERNVSVVGARKASPEGCELAAQIARDLVAADVVVTTGLAAGIDTAATRSALHDGPGTAIGVMGTPIDECYPKQNEALVETILEEGGLVVSQVPFYRYSVQPFRTKRFYFPERNELMAAISDATVIVEASDTSGTLTQARACRHQGRPLFVMRRCYEDRSLSWPRKWVDDRGARVVESAEEIVEAMDSEGLWRKADDWS